MSSKKGWEAFYICAHMYITGANMKEFFIFTRYDGTLYTRYNGGRRVGGQFVLANVSVRTVFNRS